MVDGVLPHGVFPHQEIGEMVNSGMISSKGEINKDQIGPASFEPTLGDEAFIIPASILPKAGVPLIDRLRRESQYTFPLREDECKFLHQGKIHVVPLRESLKLQKGFIGESTGRSSVGRTNTVLRLLTDNVQRYNSIPDGYEGNLYLEIFPGSFPIRLIKGLQLNQIKFAFNDFDEVDEAGLRLLHAQNPLLFNSKGEPLNLDGRIEKNSVVMSVKLNGGEGPFVYKARKDTYNKGLDFSLDFSDENNKYELEEFWEPVPTKEGSIILTPGEFYIMVTKERISVPPGFVTKMAAHDQNLADLKTQEADLFNPGHGWRTKGFSPVLEVKPYGQPIELRDGFPICRIIYQRLRSIPNIKLYDESGTYVEQVRANPGKMFK